jgi:hypothetical protein
MRRTILNAATPAVRAVLVSSIVLLTAGAAWAVNMPCSRWTPIGPAPQPFFAEAVARADDLWVAVGEDGRIATSPDAVEWRMPNSPVVQQLRGVGHGGGVWVAVGKGGTIVTSRDAATWVQRTSGVQEDLWGVAWANGRFLLNTESDLLLSSDGEQWQRLVGAGGFAIASNGSVFLGVDVRGDVRVSSDGVSWRQTGTVAAGARIWSVVWWRDRFIARAEIVGKDALYSSAYGSVWAPINLPAGVELWQVVASGGTCVLLTSDGSYATTDGLSWTAGALKPLADTVVGGADGMFVALYTSWFFSPGRADVQISTDGLTWTSASPRLYPLAARGDVVIAASGPTGPEGVYLGTATGGWRKIDLPHDPQGYLSFCAQGPRFVGLISSGGSFWSDDGLTWQRGAGADAPDWKSVAWGGDRYVAVGKKGLLASSPDGKTWELGSSGVAADLRHAIWVGSRWLVVGEGGMLLESTDGRVWASRVNSVLRDANTSLLVTDGTVVLAFGSNFLAWSADGRQFVRVPADPALPVGSAFPFNTVVWTGAEFVGVGPLEWERSVALGGVIGVSQDGWSWSYGGLESGLDYVASVLPTSRGLLAALGSGTMMRSECEAGTSVIPTVAHLGGVGGALWRTDVAVANLAPTRQSFTLDLLARNQDNSVPASRSFTLDPGLGAGYPDLLGSQFEYEGAGALRVRTNAGDGLVIASRTYNETKNGSFGQHVPAFADSEAIPAFRQATIPQLSQSVSGREGFRTNIGVVNAGQTPIEVTIALYRADAVPVGTVAVSLRAYEMQQLDHIYTRFVSAAIEDGYAVVYTNTPDGRFFAYASVIDHFTGDPIFIPAQ